MSYIIIEEKGMKRIKVTYIYYGNIYNGLRVSKTIGTNNNYFKYVRKIFNNMKSLIHEELKLEKTGIREVFRRAK